MTRQSFSLRRQIAEMLQLQMIVTAGKSIEDEAPRREVI